jgi:hypothetical protein
VSDIRTYMGPELPPLIRCAHCGTEKPQSQFNTAQLEEAKAGRPATCQACVRQRRKDGGTALSRRTAQLDIDYGL